MNAKLVKELIKKSFDLGVMNAALALADISQNKEWFADGWKIRDESVNEIEELAKKIVSRMKVIDDDV